MNMSAKCVAALSYTLKGSQATGANSEASLFQQPPNAWAQQQLTWHPSAVVRDGGSCSSQQLATPGAVGKWKQEIYLLDPRIGSAVDATSLHVFRHQPTGVEEMESHALFWRPQEAM